MELLGRHRLSWPHEELLLIADALTQLLDATKDEHIRACHGDMDELQEVVTRLEAYHRFQPDQFARREVNRRLKQYAADDKEWMWE